MSFLTVMRGFLLIAEHGGKEGKAENAPIIRLTWSVFLLHHSNFSSTVAAHISSTEEHAELWPQQLIRVSRL
jgi:hypothetical protein